MLTREEQESLIWKFLQDKLDIHSRNALYIEAFTHDYDKNIEPDRKNNQRLAYLGDMVVNFIIVNRVYSDNPTLGKGDLTKKSNKLRSDSSLAIVFKSMGLTDDHIFRPPKEMNEKGIMTMHAKVVEALFGAIYLDQGFEKARALAEKHLLQPDR